MGDSAGEFANALALGTRHGSKDDIYSHVFMLHRKLNAERNENDPELLFYARKSDKAKLLLRCGHKAIECQFRIKARFSKKQDHLDAPWLITVSDLKHTCGELMRQDPAGIEFPPADQEVVETDEPPSKKRRTVSGRRMKTAYLNTIIVREVVNILRTMDDPLQATADDIRKRVAGLVSVGRPAMTTSTARRVLVEALFQLGVTNHDDFSSLPAFAARINTLDHDANCVIHGMSTNVDFLRDVLLSKNYAFQEDKDSVVVLASRDFSASEAALETQELTKAQTAAAAIASAAILSGPMPATASSQSTSSSSSSSQSIHTTGDQSTNSATDQSMSTEDQSMSHDNQPVSHHSMSHTNMSHNTGDHSMQQSHNTGDMSNLNPPPPPVTIQQASTATIYGGAGGDGAKPFITQLASSPVENLKARGRATADQVLYFRSFVAPGYSVRAAPSLKLHFISLYAEPCVARYRGCLMSAMTLAPDGGAIVLAYGHAIAENVQNWHFFLENLRKSYPSFAESSTLVVMSNYENGLQEAVEVCFPNALHAVCLSSMIEQLLLPADEAATNMQQLDDSSTPGANTTTKSALKTFFLPCALSTSLQEHEIFLRLMETNSPATAAACRRYPIKSWAIALICNQEGRSNYGQIMLLQKRSSLKPGVSLTTMHSVESLLEVDRDLATFSSDSTYDLVNWQDIVSRYSKVPTPRLLENIYYAVQEGWESKRLEFSSFRGSLDSKNLSKPETFPKIVLCRLINTLEQVFSQSFHVLNTIPISESSNSATGSTWFVESESSPGQTYVVKQTSGMSGVSCSCGRPQATGLPCGHAIAVAQLESKSSRQFIHIGLSTASYKQAIDAAFSFAVPELSTCESLPSDQSILPPLALDHPDIVIVTGLGRKKKRACTLSLPNGFLNLIKGTEYQSTFERLCSPPAVPPSRDHCSRCHIRGHHHNTCATWGVIPGILFDNLNDRCGGPQTHTALASRPHKARLPDDASTNHPALHQIQQFQEEEDMPSMTNMSRMV